MKAKLLKRLHENCQWTYIKQDIDGGDKWILLQDGVITYHFSPQSLIKHMFAENSWKYDRIFDWNWHGILTDYREKISYRTFRKYKKQNGNTQRLNGRNEK